MHAFGVEEVLHVDIWRLPGWEVYMACYVDAILAIKSAYLRVVRFQ